MSRRAPHQDDAQRFTQKRSVREERCAFRGVAGWSAMRDDDRARLAVGVRRTPDDLFRRPPALWAAWRARRGAGRTSPRILRACSACVRRGARAPDDERVAFASGRPNPLPFGDPPNVGNAWRDAAPR